jgi:hypothetical protein
MSIPHTGKLKAEVDGSLCEFDGDCWITPRADLTARLNDATRSAPKTHYSIHELAEHVLSKAGLLKTAKILAVRSDAWPKQLPADAIE